MNLILSQYGILLWIATTATFSIFAFAMFNAATPVLMRLFTPNPSGFFTPAHPGTVPVERLSPWGNKFSTFKALGGFVLMFTAILMLTYPEIYPLGSPAFFLYATLLPTLIAVCFTLLWVDGIYLTIPHKISYLLFLILLPIAIPFTMGDYAKPQTFLNFSTLSTEGGTLTLFAVVEFVALAAFLTLLTAIFKGKLMGSGDVTLFLSLVPLSLICGPLTGVGIFFTATVLQSFIVILLLIKDWGGKKLRKGREIVQKTHTPFIFSIIVSIFLFTYPI